MTVSRSLPPSMEPPHEARDCCPSAPLHPVSSFVPLCPSLSLFVPHCPSCPPLSSEGQLKVFWFENKGAHKRSLLCLHDSGECTDSAAGLRAPTDCVLPGGLPALTPRDGRRLRIWRAAFLLFRKRLSAKSPTNPPPCSVGTQGRK